MNLKQVIYFVIATVFSLGIAGCSSGSKGSFTSQKYTNFNNKQNALKLQQPITAKAKYVFDSNRESQTKEYLLPTTTQVSANLSKPSFVDYDAPAISASHTLDNVSSDISAPFENNVFKKSFELESTNRKVTQPQDPTEDDTDLALLVLLAIFIPPVAVYLAKGLGNAFWINLLLCICFWFPGVIHALIVVLGDSGGRGGSNQRRSAAG